MGARAVSEDKWRKTYQSQPIPDFKYPWETKPEEPEFTPFEIYRDLMDNHVRVRTFKDGVQLGTFSVITSDGTDMGAEISLQNGATYKIVVVGHPVTTDPIMTPEELANYLLTC